MEESNYKFTVSQDEHYEKTFTIKSKSLEDAHEILNNMLKKECLAEMKNTYCGVTTNINFIKKYKNENS